MGSYELTMVEKFFGVPCTIWAPTKKKDSSRLKNTFAPTNPTGLNSRPRSLSGSFGAIQQIQIHPLFALKTSRQEHPPSQCTYPHPSIHTNLHTSMRTKQSRQVHTSIHTNLHTSICTKQSRSNTYKHMYKAKQKQYTQRKAEAPSQQHPKAKQQSKNTSF